MAEPRKEGTPAWPALRAPATLAASTALLLAQVAPAPAVLAPLAAGAARAQGYQTISCYSRGSGRTNCAIPKSTSAVYFVGPDEWRCQAGRNWGWSKGRIWVSGECGGDFQLRLASDFGGSGGSWGGSSGWGGSGGSWQNQGFAGEMRCTSDKYRERFCRAPVQGRAVLVRQLSSAACVGGQTWRAESGGIRVREGCDGEFAYGVGNFYPQGFGGSGGSWNQQPHQQNDGGSGGAVAGGLLAAGLIAALVAAGKSGQHSGGAPAQLQADVNKFPSASRSAARACLNEAARQVGATGGTSVRLDRVVSSRQQPDGSWRHQALLTKIWPDHRQQMRMDCVASADRVKAFDVS